MNGKKDENQLGKYRHVLTANYFCAGSQGFSPVQCTIASSSLPQTPTQHPLNNLNPGEEDEDQPDGLGFIYTFIYHLFLILMTLLSLSACVQFSYFVTCHAISCKSSSRLFLQELQAI